MMLSLRIDLAYWLSTLIAPMSVVQRAIANLGDHWAARRLHVSVIVAGWICPERDEGSSA